MTFWSQQSLQTEEESKMSKLSKHEEEAITSIFLVSRDLGWCLFTLILILCFPHHVDRATIIWVGLTGILTVARAVTIFLICLFSGESSDHSTCIGLVNCFIIILAIGLAIAASILDDHIPKFPLWLILVAPAYYMVFNFLWVCIGTQMAMGGQI